jgi:PAS domain S-box-containing protein
MVSEFADLQGALERNELVPCFQPLVELHTGCLMGFEVLARWRHPEHGLVLPQNFIALAENNGLAISLLPDPLVLAVNISPTQLLHLDLPQQIRLLAEETGYPLERLVVEITESALINNLDRAKVITAELKTIGCRLALDDFGTGYSSLGHLQALPFDELKIDRSFIRSMTSVRDSRKIVAAIIGLGHSLGIITVAEGIETEAQADMLLWLGCKQGQGWLYGKPVPVEEIARIVALGPRPKQMGFGSPGDGWAASSLEALPTQRLAQLQAIYDGAPVGLAFLDSNLRYISLNKKLADINGLPVLAHLGKTVKELYPSWYPVYEPYLLRALQGEAIIGVELIRPPTIPGEPDRLMLISYQPAWDEADEVIGVSIAVLDKSEKNSNEASLHASDDRQRHLAELNHTVPWIMDAEGNTVHMSAHWVATHNLGEHPMPNLGWLEALHTEDIEPTMKMMKDALRTGKSIDIEYRVKTIEGNWKWMRSQGSPRFDVAGDVIRWYGTVEDIDDRKRSETVN